MSLHPQWIGEVPDETARVAYLAFPQGNLYVTIRDHLGVVYEDSPFTALFSPTGQPAIAAWRLAWVTILQFAEGLSDRQAAEAVRSRIDWKYLLGLPLEDAGVDYSVLSEFRRRLVAGEMEYQLLDTLLRVCQRQGWLKAGSRSRTDSTHVLAAVERVHRYELVQAVLEAALNRCAQVAPTWLKARVPQVWFSRYGQAGIRTRPPKTETQKRELAEQIGRDGVHLLGWLAEADAPQALQTAAELQCLQVWQQQYVFTLGSPDQVQWCDKTQLPAASERIASPYDTEARYSIKGSTEWIGYKLHMTETCDPAAPHLITHKVSRTWQSQTRVRGSPVIEVNFAKRDCGACSAHTLCTRSAARILTLLSQAQFEALQAQRRAQASDAFWQLYRARAGIEGTISEATSVYGARRARYIGLAKTRLQHIATAVAMNLQRLYAWLNGEAWAKTHVAPFAALGSPTASNS